MCEFFHLTVFNHNIYYRFWKSYTDCLRASIMYVSCLSLVWTRFGKQVIFLFQVENDIEDFTTSRDGNKKLDLPSCFKQENQTKY